MGERKGPLSSVSGRAASGGTARAAVLKGFGSGPEGQIRLEESFQQKLLRMIEERGLTCAACYTKAGVSRQVFSKIKRNVDYLPSKKTAVAFALALQLSLEETAELLASAGYVLSPSRLADTVVRNCIAQEIYDIYEIGMRIYRCEPEAVCREKGNL